MYMRDVVEDRDHRELFLDEQPLGLGEHREPLVGVVSVVRARSSSASYAGSRTRGRCCRPRSHDVQEGRRVGVVAEPPGPARDMNAWFFRSSR
jgi:hypothetical protein